MKKQQPPIRKTLKESLKRKISTTTMNNSNDKYNDYYSKTTIETPRKKIVEIDVSKGNPNNPNNKSSFVKETEKKYVLKTNVSGPNKDSTYKERTIKPTKTKEGKTIIKVMGYSDGNTFNTKKKIKIPKIK